MALYLKYRPTDFSSLVGQEFIKTTLRAAINEDKTVGAYIFTGPRGTGKTSTARIFAKAINCENLNQGDPCGECSVCEGFMQGRLIDIVEIDAASHTGVDNIRDIIEKAQFSPTSTKYKIYIIDEVHMLSKGAFNALLKILEEPPNHVKFVLATTEIHKVPDTILSRCQRYDFKNFSDEDIRSRLEYIAGKEKVDVDKQSYEYIVKNAEGGMRNAVSLFEQLVEGNKISYENIRSQLGIASQQELEDFRELLLLGDTSLLNISGELQSSGKNMKIFLKSVLHSLQDIAVVKLQSGEQIHREITVMEGLSDILMKSKNSFDESLTLQIGLLKILAGDSVESVGKHSLEKSNIPQAFNTEQKKEKIVQNIEDKKVEKQEAKDLLGEAEDIFSGKEPLESTSIKIDESSSVDMKALIAECKKNGSKAAFTMSLMGAGSELRDNNLFIITKTKIAKNTILKTENMDCLMQSLSTLGIDIEEIKVS